MSPRERERAIAVLCLAGALTCYGAVPVFIRYFADYLDPWTVNALRYSVGALFWLPFIPALQRRVRAESLVAPGRSVWRDALAPSAANILGQVGYGVSPYFVTAPTIGFVLRMSFLFTILLGFLAIPEERLLARSRFFVVGAALCVGGVVVIFLESLLAEGGGSTLGLVILVSTTACWAGYIVGVRRWMAGYPVRLSFAVISLYTTGGLLVLMLTLGNLGSLATMGGRMWALLILSGFVGVTFSHVMYYRGIHTMGPVVASGSQMATPFVTLLGAALVLGESMPWPALMGGLLVVLGGALLVKAKGRIERESADRPARPQPS